MKHIIINFKHSYAVEMADYSDESVEEYTEKLSKTLDNNNVTILHATSGSLIIRPNDVSSIVVSEEEIEYADETSSTNIELEPGDPPQEEIQEDIITD